MAKDEKKAEQSRKITFSIDKSQNFPDWYDRAIEVAKIVDTRYPIKGMNAWMPYGFKALKLMLARMESLLDDSGHSEVYFPLMIPESVFSKESDFLRGFNGESFIVTIAGETELAERLYIRPTSETGMYDTVKLWIKSEADLPLKLYQTVNVFRHETRQTRPMMRVREIVKFKEAHTFHANPEDAARQVDEAISTYKKFFDMMLLPYKVLRTPSWDTFPGAEYNYDFMSVIPDGKGIELGSVINLGKKFALAFGIQYQNSKNDYSYVYQTCYGISERTLGTIMAIHGDNNGLLLPPIVAPIQAVIVPIYYAGKEEPVNRACSEIKKMLEDSNIRTSLDSRQNTAGEKFYEWEAKGVPIRIEVGPKDVENSSAVIVRRDTREKKHVKVAELVEHVTNALDDISINMKRRADAYLKERILHFDTVEDVKKEYKERLGLVGLPWCGEEKCGRSIEEKIGIPTIGYDEHKGAKGKCASCGNPGKTEMFFGRTY